MATELAQAYIQIIPSAKGIKGAIKNQIDPESASAGKSGGNMFASTFKKIVATAAIGATIGKVFKDSIGQGAQLQQSLGGVETLFKDSADTVKNYANQAYRTTGLSANAYMENVTGFSASLLQSMGGDTKKAAKVADMAMIDMADNANKMGTDMGSIQTAYQGFAKQNYTMLDNLKLGYGGTKEEMSRLLQDATKLTGVKYDINNLSDVYNAIHAVQEELGITGTTAKEASETFSGSLAAMQAAYQNVMGKLSIGEDISADLKALAQTASTFVFGNLLPMIANIAKALPGAILTFAKEAGPLFLEAGKGFIADLTKGMSGESSNLLNWLKGMFSKILGYVQDITDSVKSRVGRFKEIFNDLVSGVKPIFDTFLGVVDTWVTTIGDILSVVVPFAIDILLLSFEGFVTKVLPVIQKVMDAVSNFSTWFSGVINQYIIPAIKSVMDWMNQNKDVIIDAWGKIIGFITGVATSIYNFLVNTFSSLANWWNTNQTSILNTANSIWNSVSSTFQTVISTISNFFKNIFGALATWWNANQESILSTAKMIWNAIQVAIQIAIGAIQLVVTVILTAIKNFWDTWGSTLIAIAKVAWAAIKATFQDTLNTIQSVVSSVMTQIRIVINTVMGVIQGIIKVITGIIKGDWSSVWEGIEQITSSILNGIKDTIDNVLETAKNLVSDKIEVIKGFFTSIGDIDLYQIGKDIIQGLINGVGSMADAIGKKVSEITGGIKDKITSAFSIKSPSRWMRDFIGKNMMLGWGIGIDKNADSPTKAMASVVTGVMDELTGGTDLITDAMSSFKDANLTSNVVHTLGTRQAQLSNNSQNQGAQINIENNIQSATPLSEAEIARQERLQLQQLAYYF